MSLEVLEALKEGFSDAVSRNGLVFMAAAYVLGVVSTVGTQSSLSGMFPSFSGIAAPQATPLAVGGPAVLWGLVALLAWIGTVVLSIGVIRSFVNRKTEAIDKDYFKRNMLMAVVNIVVGGIVFGLAVGLGLILLVVPGIFIAVSLIFWQVYIAEEDQNFIDAFSNSWDLAKGNRLDLFLLGIAVFLVGIAVGLVFGIPSTALGFLSPKIAALVAGIGNAFTTVFTLATLANAYNQLQ